MLEKDKNIYAILKYLNQHNIRRENNLEDWALKTQFDLTTHDYNEAFQEISEKGYIYRRPSNGIAISPDGEIKFNQLHSLFETQESNMSKDSYRLKQSEPASNKMEFVALINERQVKDIFDPYFNNNAIKTLVSLSKLGLKFHSQVRCLTTSKASKHIDKTFWTDFNKETGVNLEIKICQSPKEHRRFLILDDNQIIIIGCSLNDIDKNEVLQEVTSSEDISFFNSEWSVGNNCP